MRRVLAFDIGGTNIKYAIVDKVSGIIESDLFSSPDTYEQLIGKISEIYDHYQNQVECAICISCPSVYKDGKIVGSSFLKYIIGKDIVSDITTKTQCKCYIENDGNCAVLGEYYFGTHNYPNMAALVIGSGVGGGLIINDQLLVGANMVAGELGFPLFNNDLGTTKPYRIVGSTLGMGNFIKRAQAIDSTIINAEQVMNSEDDKFNDLIANECQIIAMQILNLQYIVDPDVFVIGGAISASDRFINEIKNQLSKYYQLLPYHDTHAKVYPCTHGNHSNILGATVKYWRENE